MFGWIIKIAVAALVLASVIPTRTTGLDSQPNATSEYESAAAMAHAIARSENSVVARGGHSILLTHGEKTPRAVVFFHSLSNSPTQFSALAESLYNRGDNVYVARLPMHAIEGGSATTLGDLKAEQLRDVADAGVDVGAGLGDTLIVIGISTGGTMAAWVAQHRPEVKRVVIIAPRFELAKVPSLLGGPVMNLSLRLPNYTHRVPRDSTRPDKEPGFTSHGSAQGLRLGLAVRREADHTAPAASEIIFLLNEHDEKVKNGVPIDLAAQWARQGKRVSVYELPDSLGLPHDVIDQLERGARPTLVYPLVEAFAHGGAMPSWLKVVMAPTSRPGA